MEYVSPGSGRTDTEAYFRSGEDLAQIAVWGNINHLSGDGETSGDPLTEEITYREVTDILKALSGDGEPGRPQITDPEVKEHRDLAALGKPRLSAEVTTAELCGNIAGLAEDLGLEGGDPTDDHCTFSSPETITPRRSTGIPSARSSSVSMSTPTTPRMVSILPTSSVGTFAP